MKDLFLKRKQAFRKECLGYLRYVLNDHFVLFLLVLLGFLAYQYSQLLQHFSWKSLAYPFVCRNYVCSTFALGRNCHLYGGSRQALSLSRRRGNQAPSKASNWHFPSLLLFVQTLFLLLFAPLFLAMGYGLLVFLVYVLLLGVGNICSFVKKLTNFLLKLDWTGTLSFPKKASVSKSCFRFFCSLYAGQGNFKQRQASCLSGLYPKGCSEGAWEDLAKSLSAFLFAKWRSFCAQSTSSLAFLAGAGLYRASLDCDSSGSSL